MTLERECRPFPLNRLDQQTDLTILCRRFQLNDLILFADEENSVAGTSLGPAGYQGDFVMTNCILRCVYLLRPEDRQRQFGLSARDLFPSRPKLMRLPECCSLVHAEL
jgi:hypothetical protein